MKSLKHKILWADDEIDHLKSHILFLEGKGYAVTPVANAEDAISLAHEERFDLVLLDEMMTGMDGLQALVELKEMDPSLPVIMITKNEEENLIEEALGRKIDDYLTKPVNPSQILSSCKRILEKKKIAQEKLTREYTVEFGEISSLLDSDIGPEDWVKLHLKLSEREIELDEHPDIGFRQMLQDQRRECNRAFGRYIDASYEGWVNGGERPILSVDLFRRYVAPLLYSGEAVLFLLIDNLRLDQWLVIEPMLNDYFIVTRDHYFSILPTATPYSRNSIFAGLFPREIEEKYPELWRQGEDDESSRNRYESQLLKDQIARLHIHLKQEPKYVKLLDVDDAKQAAKHAESYFAFPLSVMVFNFVDILAHRRSESQILREIVPDESAYRSLTRSWFERSHLFQILKSAAEAGVTVVATSDHGSIRAMRGSTVHADRETSTNLRYKYGKGIRGEKKQVLEIKDPRRFGLPSLGINTNYLIAKEDCFFVYPTNYHRYLAMYRDSLQHGGISLEEMVLPVAVLRSK